MKTNKMKTIIILLISITLSVGVSAQYRGVSHGSSHGSSHGYSHARVTRVYISPIRYEAGFGYGYPYYGNGFGFPYSGYYGNPYPSRTIPYKLDLEIQKIKADYKGQIQDVRNDKSISGAERRQEIRALKNDRDKDIINAKMNFRRPSMNNQNRGQKYQRNNQNPELNNQQNNQNPDTNNNNNQSNTNS